MLSSPSNNHPELFSPADKVPETDPCRPKIFGDSDTRDTIAETLDFSEWDEVDRTLVSDAPQFFTPTPPQQLKPADDITMVTPMDLRGLARQTFSPLNPQVLHPPATDTIFRADTRRVITDPAGASVFDHEVQVPAVDFILEPSLVESVAIAPAVTAPMVIVNDIAPAVDRVRGYVPFTSPPPPPEKWSFTKAAKTFFTKKLAQKETAEQTPVSFAKSIWTKTTALLATPKQTFQEYYSTLSRTIKSTIRNTLWLRAKHTQARGLHIARYTFAPSAIAAAMVMGGMLGAASTDREHVRPDVQPLHTAVHANTAHETSSTQHIAPKHNATAAYTIGISKNTPRKFWNISSALFGFLHKPDALQAIGQTHYRTDTAITMVTQHPELRGTLGTITPGYHFHFVAHGKTVTLDHVTDARGHERLSSAPVVFYVPQQG